MPLKKKESHYDKKSPFKLSIWQQKDHTGVVQTACVNGSPLPPPQLCGVDGIV